MQLLLYNSAKKKIFVLHALMEFFYVAETRYYDIGLAENVMEKCNYIKKNK